MGYGGHGGPMATMHAIPPRVARKAMHLKPLPKHAGTPMPEEMKGGEEAKALTGGMGLRKSLSQKEMMIVASLSSGICPVSMHGRPRRKRLCPLPPLPHKKGAGGAVAVGQGGQTVNPSGHASKPVLEPLPGVLTSGEGIGKTPLLPVEAPADAGGGEDGEEGGEGDDIVAPIPEKYRRSMKRRSSIGQFDIPKETPQGQMLLPEVEVDKKKKKKKETRVAPLLQVGSMSRLMSPPAVIKSPTAKMEGRVMMKI